MKIVTIYGIKNCDSVKKAIKYFKERGIDYTLVDFKESPVNKEKIEYWLTQIDLNKLFNKKSTTYRNLKLKELNLDEHEEIEWLVKENLLIKRPIIEYNNKTLIGFNKDTYDQIF